MSILYVEDIFCRNIHILVCDRRELVISEIDLDFVWHSYDCHLKFMRKWIPWLRKPTKHDFRATN